MSKKVKKLSFTADAGIAAFVAILFLLFGYAWYTPSFAYLLVRDFDSRQWYMDVPAIFAAYALGHGFLIAWRQKSELANQKVENVSFARLFALYAGFALLLLFSAVAVRLELDFDFATVVVGAGALLLWFSGWRFDEYLEKKKRERTRLQANGTFLS